MNDTERLNQTIDLAIQLRDNVVYFCTKYNPSITGECDEKCPFYILKADYKCESAVGISQLKKVELNINSDNK